MGYDDLGHDGAETIPALPRVYLQRPLLWQRLEAACSSGLTLLVGPSGAGKTLGVAGWVRSLAVPPTWINADARLAPTRLRRFLTAPDVVDAGAGRPGLVVVDDAHQLSAGALSVVDGLLQSSPTDIRLLLLSRHDLPLHKLVPEMTGHMTTLTGELLRLSPDEAHTLIAQHSDLATEHVPRDLGEAIMERTEGWCAAVVLAARASAVAIDTEQFALAYRNAGSPADELVPGEVFAAMTSQERHVLLCTAFERSMTAEEARELTHDAEAGDVLARLAAVGMLVTREAETGLGTPREGEFRFRVHPLLRELARHRLSAGGVDVEQAKATVLRSIRLALARGEVEAAFRRLVAWEQFESAVDVLTEHPLRLVMKTPRAIARLARSGHLEPHPACWLVAGIERWQVGDQARSRHWLGQLLQYPDLEGRLAVDRACARLINAEGGLAPVVEAVEAGRDAIDAAVEGTREGALVPLLSIVTGAAANWAGQLDLAEDMFTRAVMTTRPSSLWMLTVEAISELALNQYMRAREGAARALAVEALETASQRQVGPEWSLVRARAILTLTDFDADPWPQQTPGETEPTSTLEPGHRDMDLCSRFWMRIAEARHALRGGSIERAQLLLNTPIEVPTLSPHLEVSLMVDRAMVALVYSDGEQLLELAGSLEVRGAACEAAWVRGAESDLRGDVEAALEGYRAAVDAPPVGRGLARLLGMIGAAQLYDARGQAAPALELLRRALTITETRRLAVPFAGWSPHGTPVPRLLRQVDASDPNGWAARLLGAADGHPGVFAWYAPRVGTPRERAGGADLSMRPPLSPRERDVLNGLARGATYADIAKSLYVTENTVKTHVSSLYAKLAAGRRSEALATARRLNML